MATKLEIAADVRQAITDQIGYTHEQIDDGKDLEADLHCDALDLVELAMVLEERFEIVIPKEDASAVHTVGDWILLVQGKLAEKGRVSE